MKEANMDVIGCNNIIDCKNGEVLYIGHVKITIKQLISSQTGTLKNDEVEIKIEDKNEKHPKKISQLEIPLIRPKEPLSIKPQNNTIPPQPEMHILSK